MAMSAPTVDALNSCSGRRATDAISGPSRLRPTRPNARPARRGASNPAAAMASAARIGRPRAGRRRQLPVAPAGCPSREAPSPSRPRAARAGGLSPPRQAAPAAAKTAAQDDDRDRTGGGVRPRVGRLAPACATPRHRSRRGACGRSGPSRARARMTAAPSAEGVASGTVARAGRRSPRPRRRTAASTSAIPAPTAGRRTSRWRASSGRGKRHRPELERDEEAESDRVSACMTADIRATARRASRPGTRCEPWSGMAMGENLGCPAAGVCWRSTSARVGA